ncbi:Hypothetical predicted protein [Mytilus galloprovincialis]|uniref:Uncharacterized protein n=1 Tax=Mytilus galloprovincialis TaxID=29158 RepID=A0A8B6EL14_MYTGA|nr:Hypothetical predicted protein [Mytilus galloprovincialis]
MKSRTGPAVSSSTRTTATARAFTGWRSTSRERDPSNFSIHLDVLRSITFVASGTCSSPMDLNTDSVRLKCNRDHPIRADSIVYIS